jgi:hypothetical protein
VTSSRILFVVADVRDPLRERSPTEEEWGERVAGRCGDLQRWTEEAITGPRRDLFWFAPARTLSEETLYNAPVWGRAGQGGGHALVA